MTSKAGLVLSHSVQTYCGERTKQVSRYKGQRTSLKKNPLASAFAGYYI